MLYNDLWISAFKSSVSVVLFHPSRRRKMVNGSRYYRALESVSIASALSTALTIYPCHIRVHQRWQSKLQLPTARKKDWRPATADSSPQAVTCQHCDTHLDVPFQLILQSSTYRSFHLTTSLMSASEPFQSPLPSRGIVSLHISHRQHFKTSLVLILIIWLS